MRSDSGLAELRASFEAKLTDLRGRCLTAVDYWGVHNFGPAPVQWDYGWHHAVMGVQLSTDQGPATVTWTGSFYPYGVEVFHDPITDHLVLGEDGPQRVGPDAGRPGVWASYFGSPIRGGAFHWERVDARHRLCRPGIPSMTKAHGSAQPSWSYVGVQAKQQHGLALSLRPEVEAPHRPSGVGLPSFA